MTGKKINAHASSIVQDKVEIHIRGQTNVEFWAA